MASAPSESVLALAHDAAEQLDGPEAPAWFDRLEAVHDDLRSTFDSLIGEGRGAAALALAADLWPFQYDRGHVQEGRA